MNLVREKIEGEKAWLMITEINASFTNVLLNMYHCLRMEVIS